MGITLDNLLLLLQEIDLARIAVRASDSAFLQRYDEVMGVFEHHRRWSDTWWGWTCWKPADRRGPCVEPGCILVLIVFVAWARRPATTEKRVRPGVPIVGVGLFYTNGYFDQKGQPRRRADRQRRASKLGGCHRAARPPSGEEWTTVVDVSADRCTCGRG